MSFFLSALTPPTGYQSYPPFINFSIDGNFVRVIIRGHEKYDQEKGWYLSGDMAEAKFHKTQLVEVLEEVLQKLKSD